MSDDTCPNCGCDVNGEQVPHVSWQDVAQVGGCNFCTRRTARKVKVLRPAKGGLEVRACAICLQHIIKRAKRFIR